MQDGDGSGRPDQPDFLKKTLVLGRFWFENSKKSGLKGRAPLTGD